ncbi:MAG: rod shape-determining protein RodA [Bradyrhizobium sp.]|uniref:rod shape-determining protein RodA n=1 Tax=Bradyrhizobium sp. TaxID=376 RepID=UPI0025BF6811|nr:rod shape-determining protein RodA [Bradyrhizobium sp.]MCA3581179.1 rod shape-determining protein RodA [Bradyrhizobium sp.]
MQPLALSDRLRALPWSVILAVVVIGAFGNLILFSAAGGSMTPWALNQSVRFVVLLGLMLAIAQINIEIWIRFAYPIYGAVLVLLIIVEAFGFVGMGAQRWLDLGVIRLQPSEFMKIAIILALARFYHFLPRSFTERPQAVWPPLAMIGVPFILVAIQPDLGTGLMIAFGGIAMLFLAGVRMRWFIGGIALAAAAIPLAYEFLLHDYQRRRILTFLDPSSDPLGAGYHITQSKIAIGSGGLFGKGFLHGTQGALEYLPERQTDFIFAMMAEEWGLAGGLFLYLVYGYVIAWGIGVALSAKSHFARLAAMGLTCTLFFYLAINTAMVMGLAPVVGIPLPLVSYGGSAMLTVLTTMGILISISRHRDRAMLGDHPSAL